MAPWRALVLMLSCCIAACGGDEADDWPCPAIACLLRISVSNPPTEPYRVEATAAGQATPQVQECASGGNCFIAFGSHLFPGQLTVRVVLTASGTIERSSTVTPTYSTTELSAHCGGICRNAGVTI
jgi:hypothetical protein